MKRLITLAVVLLALGVTAVESFAATDPPRVPPKAIEGPDSR